MDRFVDRVERVYLGLALAACGALLAYRGLWLAAAILVGGGSSFALVCRGRFRMEKPPRTAAESLFHLAFAALGVGLAVGMVVTRYVFATPIWIGFGCAVLALRPHPWPPPARSRVDRVHRIQSERFLGLGALICLLCFGVGLIDQVTPTTATAVTIESRNLETPPRSGPFKTVRIRTDSGVETVRSGELYELMSDGRARPGVGSRAAIGKGLRELSIEGRTHHVAFGTYQGQSIVLSGGFAAILSALWLGVRAWTRVSNRKQVQAGVRPP